MKSKAKTVDFMPFKKYTLFPSKQVIEVQGKSRFIGQGQGRSFTSDSRMSSGLTFSGAEGYGGQKCGVKFDVSAPHDRPQITTDTEWCFQH